MRSKPGFRAILVGPTFGRSRLPRVKIHPRDRVIGVDAGAWWALKAGMSLDLAIGDFDSLSKIPGGLHAIRKTPSVRLKREKDLSDLGCAIRFAREAGASELLCLGFTGGPRLDHHLGALYDLSEASSHLRVSAQGPDGGYHFLSPKHPKLALKVARGATLSVFPMGGPASGVSLRGFKYAAPKGPFPATSRGVSNQARRRHCAVSLKRGKLVVAIPYA